MRKRNMIRWIFGIPAIVLILIGIILFCEPDRSGITRAAAAKSVALALISPEELNAWEKEYGASHFPADAMGNGMFRIWIIYMKQDIWMRQIRLRTGSMQRVP